jgi:hypothetical protein
MKDPKGNRHALRQVKIIVLLPLTIFLWMTGWTLAYIGAQGMSSRTAQKKTVPSSQKETHERETLKKDTPPQILP